MKAKKKGICHLAVANFIIFGIIPFAIIVSLAACDGNTEKVFTERTENTLNLPIQNTNTVFTQNPTGNGEPFACDFRIVYGEQTFSFKAVNSKKLVGICTLMKQGDLSRFKVYQITRGDKIIDTSIYWYADDGFNNIQGSLVVENSQVTNKL